MSDEVAVIKRGGTYLEYDEEAWAALQAEYSQGRIDQEKYSIRCYRLANTMPLCMKCGQALEDRSKFRIVKGVWIPRKSPGQSCWVCNSCNPLAGQPLAVGISPKIVRPL